MSLYLIVCTLLLSLAVSEFRVLSWAPWFSFFFFLVQDERYMSNLILLHIETQSFLLSFLWHFWQCCQKTDGCHLDILLHWSTAWFDLCQWYIFSSSVPFCVHVYICSCFHLHGRIYGYMCTFIHMYKEVQIDVKDHPGFFIEFLMQCFSSKPRVPCYD